MTSLRAAVVVMCFVSIARGAAAGVTYPASAFSVRSVRAAGLGGAYTALVNARDPMSATINPAGPAAVRDPTWGSIHPWLSEMSVTAGSQEHADGEFLGRLVFGGVNYRPGPRFPIRLPIGVSIYAANYRIEGIRLIDRAGAIQGTFDSTDAMLGGALALDVSRAWTGEVTDHKMFFGVGLNMATIRADPFTSNQLISLAFGIVSTGPLHEFVPAPQGSDYLVGVAALNTDLFLPWLNEMQSTSRKGEQTDRLPTVVRGGAALRYRIQGREVLLTADGTGEPETDSGSWAIAMESRFGERAATFVRVGYSSGLGEVRDQAYWSYGLGLLATGAVNLRLDLSLQDQPELPNRVYMSLNLIFSG